MGGGDVLAVVRMSHMERSTDCIPKRQKNKQAEEQLVARPFPQGLGVRAGGFITIRSSSGGAGLEKSLRRRDHCIWKETGSASCPDTLDKAWLVTLRPRELEDDDSQHSANIGGLLVLSNSRWEKEQ